MQMMPKHITGSSSTVLTCFATRVTRCQNVVLRRISGRGHFQSCDKDGGHTIRSAMVQNRSYCQLNFYIVEIWNFTYFCKKLNKNIKIFHLYRKIDVDDAEIHFLTYYRLF